MESRRDFLKGAGAAAVFAQFAGIRRRAFAGVEGAATHSGFGAAFRRQYTLAAGVTYLNHASIGTVPLAVQDAHRGYLELCETNPWLYMWSEPWREPLEEVRARGARLLGCDSEEVAITHNTTEFFSMLAQGMPLGPGDEVLFSSLNHSGASVCWFHQAQTRGFTVRQFDFPLADLGTLDANAIVGRYERALGPKTRLLVLPHVDNMVGLRHPVTEIAAMAHRRGVRWVAVDGAQTTCMLPVDVGSMGVDLFATSAHKWIQSPKGLGMAYVRRELVPEIRPMWVTWGQKLWQGSARVFEDYGTRALPAVLALGDALDFQEKIEVAEREAHYRRLRGMLQKKVAERDDLLWRSPPTWDLGASLVAVGVKKKKSTEIAARLYQDHGIVVRPFDLPDLDALRISPNLSNDVGDLERLLAAI